MRLLLVCLCTFLAIESIAQSKFEQGYFIDNSGNITECLLKNRNNTRHPMRIRYKTLDGNLETTTIDSVAEFGIPKKMKYIRRYVLIDRSSEDANNISLQKEPEFENELIFLKVLVDGRADLFLYKDINLLRFFYQTDTSQIKQLIYKSYKNPADKILTNNSFIYQLSSEVSCPEFTYNDYNIQYKEKTLAKYFIRYNKCVGTEPVTFEQTKNSYFINLTLRPGLNYSTFGAKRYHFDKEYIFKESKPTFRMGIEVELGVFKGDLSDWSVILEPTWRTFQLKRRTATQLWELDYTSIEIPLGVRYYRKLNHNSSCFANFSIVSDVCKQKIYISLQPEKIISTPNLSFGAGYKYNRLSGEVKFFTTRDLMDGYLYPSALFKNISLIIGYTILQSGKGEIED